jgi:hypothetical protein
MSDANTTKAVLTRDGKVLTERPDGRLPGGGGRHRLGSGKRPLGGGEGSRGAV